MSLCPLPEFHIERRAGAVEIIFVTGELDLCTAPYLAAELGSAQRSGADVIVNLEKVTFFDCAALRVLLSASAEAGPAAFSVTPGPRQVQRFFQLTGALAELNVVPPGMPALEIAA